MIKDTLEHAKDMIKGKKADSTRENAATKERI